MAYEPSEWEKHTFGNYTEKKPEKVTPYSMRKEAYYQNAFDTAAQNYAKKHGLEYNDKLKKALKQYYREQGTIDKIASDFDKASATQHSARVKSASKFMNNNPEYVKMYRKMGGQQEYVTKRDFEEQMKLNDYSLNKLKKKQSKHEHSGLSGLFGKLKNITKDTDGNGRAQGFDFLDKTLGRASRSAQELVFGKDFVKNQAEAYNDTDNNQVKEMNKAINKKAETGLEKAGDILGTGVGLASYLVPGAASVKGARGLGNLAKLSKPGSQAAAKLAGDTLGKKALRTGIEGTGAALLFGAGNEAMTEAVDPDRYSAKDHARNIGLEVALGALGDPALTIGGAKLGKFLSKLKKDNPKLATQVEKSIGERVSQVPPAEQPFNVLAKPVEVDTALSKLSPSTVPETSLRANVDLEEAPLNDLAIEPKINIESSMQPKSLGDLITAASKQRNVEPFEGIASVKNDQDPLAALRKVEEFEAISPVEEEFPLIKVPNADNQLLKGLSPNEFKDKSGFGLYTTDIYRNLKDVTGEQYPQIKERLLDPFDASKGDMADMEKLWATKLKSEVVDRLGIKKGSKLSKLVQDYGEKTISLPELKTTAPKDWQKVVEADKWFRNTYDELIDTVNAARVQIYPDNPDKLIPKREDYYRHFKEFGGLTGLKNLFDTPAGIDPSLVGTSEFTKPSSKFLSFAQKRGNGPYKNDAVGGFLDYIPAASYATHIDKHIPNFKQFIQELKDVTGDQKHLNNTIEFLEDFSRDLAGKTNPADRFPQKLIGRKAFNFIHSLNNRVKANVILGNVGSVLAQVANVPNGVAFAKQHSIKGAGRTIQGLISEDAVVKKSAFMKERFGKNIYNQFDTRLIDQPKKFAAWMIETADKVGTSFVWNSAYQKGLVKKVANPIKYADDETRRLVAGRGVGEVPLAQKAKVTQLIAPFQLEVANLWRVQKEFVKEKDFAGLMLLYVGAFVLNKGMEATRGSGVMFDPISAVKDAATEEDLTLPERGGRIAGEVLSNLPLGQTLANVYPEFGVGELPARDKLFGDRDPNRFGSGLTITKGIQDPLYKLLPPFGGNQVSKMVKGLDALKKGGVYTEDGSKLKYQVSDDPVNTLKAVLFGLSSLKESKEYYDNKGTPLSAKQTETYELARKNGNGKEAYNEIMRERNVNKLNRAITALKKDKGISQKERENKLEELLRRLQEVEK